MLYFINILLVFSILQTVVSLNYVEEECVNTYTDDLDNDFLIGTWYEIYKFTSVHLLPSHACTSIVITKPSRTEVQKYVDAYKLDNPFSFDDNPVLLERDGRWKGMILGRKTVKFFIYDPDTTSYKPDFYGAKVYEKVNDDYILFQECNMRGHMKWLLSRKKIVQELKI
ncbi:unnamed protein product [Euphydryas editha]|uniref:Uncharacterized protein n=1 Tax=Euphydryas editha TaxID=104508 RepID=A0AAU9TFB8_EUPED|nr:unnamed protein product [Euphydryas editha]